MIKISPSMLACDFARMGEEAAAVEKAGADMLHLDIMDGHFVPNISFGPPVIASLRKRSGLLFDVHLMVSYPLLYAGAFIGAGADIITFHIESLSDPLETINAVKSAGKSCGLVLKPKTPAEAIEKYLPRIDMALVMTVEPGFGGQKFMPEALEKIARLRALADKLNPGLDIEVDGGIDADTAPLVVKAGANVLVAGSSVFSTPDYASAISGLRAVCKV